MKCIIRINIDDFPEEAFLKEERKVLPPYSEKEASGHIAGFISEKSGLTFSGINYSDFQYIFTLNFGDLYLEKEMQEIVFDLWKVTKTYFPVEVECWVEGSSYVNVLKFETSDYDEFATVYPEIVQPPS